MGADSGAQGGGWHYGSPEDCAGSKDGCLGALTRSPRRKKNPSLKGTKSPARKKTQGKTQASRPRLQEIELFSGQGMGFGERRDVLRVVCGPEIPRGQIVTPGRESF